MQSRLMAVDMDPFCGADFSPTLLFCIYGDVEYPYGSVDTLYRFAIEGTLLDASSTKTTFTGLGDTSGRTIDGLVMIQMRFYPRSYGISCLTVQTRNHCIRNGRQDQADLSQCRCYLRTKFSQKTQNAVPISYFFFVIYITKKYLRYK